MGHKILLADDSITIQKVVNLTFSDEGIDVVTVGNGEMAIRKLNDVKPDLVLADIYMPGKNGYEVCEYIKTHPQFSRMPVLLLVGAFEPFDQVEAARVKADGHLTKPFESRTLVATVNRLLAQIPPAPAPEPPAPQQWQGGSVPPDSTTTRLNPEAIVHFQFDHPVDSPVKASPVPADIFQPPVASPVAPPATLQFNFSPPPPPVASPPSMPTTEFSAEIPPAEEPPPKFEFDFTAPEPVAEPSPVEPPAPRPTPLPDFSAHFDAQEEVFDQTISMGVADLPEIKAQMPIARDPEEAEQAVDVTSPLELTEVESAEIPYEDMPLDLEPLEDITYQAETDSVLEISEPVAASVDAEPVLEKITTTEQEALPEPEQVQAVVTQQRRTTLEMVSLSGGEEESAKPVFELPPEEPLPPETYSDILPAQMAAVEEPIQVSEPPSAESPVEATPFVFEMPAEPETPVQAPVFEPPAIEQPPVFEAPVVAEQAAPVYDPATPAYEAPEAVAASFEPVTEAVYEEAPPAPEPTVPEAVYEEATYEAATSAPEEAASFEPPAIEQPPVEAPVEQAAPVYETTAPAYEAPEPSVPEPVYEAAAPDYASQPVAQARIDLQSLTIDQIPQHLIDEIVKRTIAQMSENVVREIAWEVVPDLAELLIKKRLDQNHR